MLSDDLLGAEWLEADGLGGFASGTVSGARSRRYHALLLAAATPPTGRVVLVNGMEAFVETPAGRFALSSERYAPEVTHPDGARRIASFTAEPWPLWRFRLEDGTEIEQEIFAVNDAPVTAVAWRLVVPRDGVTLAVRPYLSGRDYHSLHRENGSLRFDAEVRGAEVAWRTYGDVPAVIACTNGEYAHQPEWYRNFLYAHERERGLDDLEDLASPGVVRWNLSSGDAVFLLAAGDAAARAHFAAGPARAFADLRAAERARRAAFPSRLHRAADAYIVRRGAGKTIVAGYPWFTDWGRDTFIAMRGLCLAAGRLDDARDILLEWAGAISGGMIPNRFADSGEAPEYNAVDASLWYVLVVADWIAEMQRAGRSPTTAHESRLAGAVAAILDGYTRGTRFGIRMDSDGLLAAGERGVQLTWMDAKVGDRVITPRIGKPVEVEALWINALHFGERFAAIEPGRYDRALAAFRERFWNDAAGALFDVVDVEHERGTQDGTFRPNQIFAVGGLPLTLLDPERARRVVDAVEARLWTPIGLRSLAPDEAGYAPRYEGGPAQRDAVYHQGTGWAWLLGPFVEAWLRVRGSTDAARREARARFLEPLLAHLETAGLGHVSEIADAQSPHTPRGCPFQAWSVGEAMRIARLLD
ncbi:MAG: amylo-alpha-1,6-glucosidase [bacterium]